MSAQHLPDATRLATQLANLDQIDAALMDLCASIAAADRQLHDATEAYVKLKKYTESLRRRLEER